MISFAVWLRKQIFRDDPVSDLSLDASNDKDFPRGKYKDPYYEHLVNMNACEDALQAFSLAYTEYLLENIDFLNEKQAKELEDLWLMSDEEKELERSLEKYREYINGKNTHL